jgi:two-component system OmpR family sensor kinase
MPWRSIRARLTLWYTSLLTLSFLLLGGAGYGLLSYTLSQEADAALRGVAQTMAEREGGRPESLIPGEIDEIFRQFFGFSPLDRYFERLSPLDRPHPGASPPGGGKLPLSQEALKNASRGLPTFETVKGLAPFPVRVLTWPVVRGGRVTGLIQVGMSRETLEKTRGGFLLIMAGMLPVALLLAGGGGWVLARKALKPVDRMTETARRISAEHLDRQVQGSGTGDELDRLARTLNEMLGRLNLSFREIRQFSADASHELQTPLTVLKGEIEVGLRSPRKPEEYQAILRSALEETDRIARLVEGLLLLSRSDAGVLRMDRRPVELKTQVEEVIGAIRPLALSRSVNLEGESLEPVQIMGDPDHLRRLFLNLLDNGIKYTPAGGSVEVSLHKDDRWAYLRIRDSGIGIAPEDQEKIFRRFTRAERARSQGGSGSGLGLAIAKSIAEAHGGRIGLESAEGRGSQFTVLLPLSS